MTSLLYPYEQRRRGEEIAAHGRDIIVQRACAERDGRPQTEFVLIREDDLVVLLHWAEVGLAAARDKP